MQSLSAALIRPGDEDLFTLGFADSEGEDGALLRGGKSGPCLALLLQALPVKHMIFR